MLVEWDNKQYVCFDKKTGDIFSVGPSKESGYEALEVSEEEIEPIISLKVPMAEYAVVYSRIDKRFVLKRKNLVSNDIKLRKLCEIKENTAYDVLLEVDKSNNICYINTDYSLLETMQDTNVDIQDDIIFHFTKSNDPHVLYKTIEFNINEKKQEHIELDKNYSIYTNSVSNCVYREI